MSILDPFEDPGCSTPIKGGDSGNSGSFSMPATSKPFDSPGQASTVYSSNGDNRSSMSEDSFGEELRKVQVVNDRRNA